MSEVLEQENKRLRECLQKANSQAEHFEREWYLRGDEIERLEALCDEMFATMTLCIDAYASLQRSLSIAGKSHQRNPA